MALYVTTTIDRVPLPQDDPQHDGRRGTRMREYEGYVLHTMSGCGVVGSLIPQDDDTVRGVVMRLRRAADRLRVRDELELWIADDVVYFRARGDITD